MDRPVPSWFYSQAGVIPYRVVEGRIEIALVSSASGKRWVIPKGVIDPGETARGTAEREALEEAGLSGALSGEPIGSYRYEKWNGTCTVEVYLLAVDAAAETWAESAVRARRWWDPVEAAARLREPELQRLVRSVPQRVGEAMSE